MRVLPTAHRELVEQLAGRIRPSTAIRELEDNVLVAMILVDLLHPLKLDPPNLKVTVMDVLEKYHDFPWAACESLTVRDSIVCGCGVLTSAFSELVDIPPRVSKTLFEPDGFFIC